MLGKSELRNIKSPCGAEGERKKRDIPQGREDAILYHSFFKKPAGKCQARISTEKAFKRKICSPINSPYYHRSNYCHRESYSFPIGSVTKYGHKDSENYGCY
jgi:hypothetical protein